MKETLFTIGGGVLGVAAGCGAFWLGGYDFDTRGITAVACAWFSFLFGAAGAGIGNALVYKP